MSVLLALISPASELPGSDFLPEWNTGRSHLALDARLRASFAETPGREDANAITFRVRPSLTHFLEGGGSFRIGLEGTFPVDEGGYDSGSVDGNLDRAAIADPGSLEIDELWFAQPLPAIGARLKVGRQRIRLGNGRHLGNVGWRQNQQTFDAATIAFGERGNTQLLVGSLWQSNRIFGSDVREGGKQDFTGGSGFAHLASDLGGEREGSLYVLALDLENAAGSGASNLTFGGSLETPLLGGKLFAEAAVQSDFSGSPLDYTAPYGHLSWTGSLGPEDAATAGFTLGAELLGTGGGESFQFPLGTNHAFNGFADVFQITPEDGLLDFYGELQTSLPSGIDAHLGAHYFTDADAQTRRGSEIDLTIGRSFRIGDRRAQASAKFAHFFAASGEDTQRLTLQVEWNF